MFMERTADSGRNTLSFDYFEHNILAGVAGSSEEFVSVTEGTDRFAPVIFVCVIVVNFLIHPSAELMSQYVVSCDYVVHVVHAGFEDSFDVVVALVEGTFIGIRHILYFLIVLLVIVNNQNIKTFWKSYS